MKFVDLLPEVFDFLLHDLKALYSKRYEINPDSQKAYQLYGFNNFNETQACIKNRHKVNSFG